MVDQPKVRQSGRVLALVVHPVEDGSFVRLSRDAFGGVLFGVGPRAHQFPEDGLRLTLPRHDE